MQWDRSPDHRVPVHSRVCMRHAKACQNLSWQYGAESAPEIRLGRIDVLVYRPENCIYLDTGVCKKALRRCRSLS